MMAPITPLETAELRLRALTSDDASEEYLGWLNDPDVLRYRAPRVARSTMDDVRRYIDGIAARGDLVLAIHLKATGRHIGNIALNTIVPVHGTAELSLMVGAKDVWGRGLAKEAIEVVSGHAFGAMGLRRLWAESPNPAFNAAVKRLGWTHEGTKRCAFALDGGYVDIECWGLLQDEFRPRLAAV